MSRSTPRAGFRRPIPNSSELSLTDPIESLPRIGTARAAALQRVGVHTIEDLLFFLPTGHRTPPPHRSIAEAIAGATVGERLSTIRGTVTRYRSGRRLGTPSRLVVADETGSIEVVAFQLRRVPGWMSRGREIVVEGRVEVVEGAARIHTTHYSAPDEALAANALRPVYRLPDLIPARDFARWIRLALPLCEAIVDPRDIADLAPWGLPGLPAALSAIHAPDDESVLEPARRRFALEELATWVAPLVARRRSAEHVDKQRRLALDDVARDRMLEFLPFPPTAAQRKAFAEIAEDLARPAPMHRLLQGEVGSGKTAVALLALLAVARAGYTCALLVPTAPLARQHFESARSLFSAAAIPVYEYSAAVPAGERRQIAARLRSPHPCLVVGTLQLANASRNVAFAVIDEQQRFGVSQRARLRADPRTDLLVMTATPIPRSLALVLYGDLDVSVLRELPPGRAKVATLSIRHERGDEWIRFVADEVAREGRVFVVCPMIRGGDEFSVERATSALRRELGSTRVGVAHGSTKPEENQRAIARFRAGEVAVLVTTVLVEVGIDVPDATAIVVLGADRFGLAQLHQLRGRVGRGAHSARCALVSRDPKDLGRARIDALLRTDSGFEIAEADLDLRGAGELAGSAQHGVVDFRFVRLPRDLDLIPLAAKGAGVSRIVASRPVEGAVIGPG